MPAIIDLLIKKGADPNIPNKLGCTPTIQAVSDGDMPTLKALINSKKVDVNKKAHNGNSPMHVAAEAPFAHEDLKIIMEFLLSEGANINVQNKAGQTPLMLAVRKHPVEELPLDNIELQSKVEVIEYLVKKDAKTTIKDVLHRDALDYAGDYCLAALDCLIKETPLVGEHGKD